MHDRQGQNNIVPEAWENVFRLVYQNEIPVPVSGLDGFPHDHRGPRRSHRRSEQLRSRSNFPLHTADLGKEAGMTQAAPTAPRPI